MPFSRVSQGPLLSLVCFINNDLRTSNKLQLHTQIHDSFFENSFSVWLNNSEFSWKIFFWRVDWILSNNWKSQCLSQGSSMDTYGALRVRSSTPAYGYTQILLPSLIKLPFYFFCKTDPVFSNLSTFVLVHGIGHFLRLIFNTLIKCFFNLSSNVPLGMILKSGTGSFCLDITLHLQSFILFPC